MGSPVTNGSSSLGEGDEADSPLERPLDPKEPVWDVKVSGFACCTSRKTVGALCLPALSQPPPWKLSRRNAPRKERRQGLHLLATASHSGFLRVLTPAAAWNSSQQMLRDVKTAWAAPQLRAYVGTRGGNLLCQRQAEFMHS